jgi:pimeloyl-ACP methyl ester carboxylesterase
MAYFDSNGVKIHYQEFGAGDPVMLVHGFASTADGNWGELWFSTLAKHYRVIALDCRGHGKSDKPHDPAAYGGETMGDDVIRLLDHLGIRRTLLMGYSMGGRISLGLLAHHPERLRAVVLGGIGANAAAIRDPARRRRIVDALLAADGSQVTDEVGRQFRLFAEANHNDLKALGACMGGHQPEFSLDAYANNRVPVLLVIGTKDTLVGSAEPLQAAIKGSRLVKLEGRDHLTAPGDPRYKEEVLKFFQSAPV